MVSNEGCMDLSTAEDLHLIKGWRQVAHQGHQEEGDLKDRLGQKFQAVEKIVVPCCTLEIDNP